MYANLLKYSMIPLRQLRRQSTMQRRKAAPLSESDRALSTMARSVSMIATRRLPKQMLPKDVVVARRKLSLMAEEQKELASSGANHHVDTTPAIMTWIVFCQDDGTTGRRDDGRDRGTGRGEKVGRRTKNITPPEPSSRRNSPLAQSHRRTETKQRT
jgi:hypothetical protein